jgi:hypothetical protein
MRTKYQARWITKGRCDALKRSGKVRDAVVLNTFEGIIVVEPTGKHLGDGPALSLHDADYELLPAWCLDSPRRLAEARRRLGLKADPLGD